MESDDFIGELLQKTDNQFTKPLDLAYNVTITLLSKADITQ